MLRWKEFSLKFLEPAKTSRGTYENKKVTLIFLEQKGKTGVGEASPLPDLSVDGKADLKIKLEEVREKLDSGISIPEIIEELPNSPSLQFALECAQLQIVSENDHLFQTDYTKGENPIRINGLVWMNEAHKMENAAIEKARAGFTCIKFKIGALDHDAECRMVESVRKQFSTSKLEIRLDANGAYHFDESLPVIKDFSRFGIHSMEQPLRAGQWEATAEVCAKSKIPVALDEELIGLTDSGEKEKLMQKIQPQYLVLKPTLLGGFRNCDNWISLAEKSDCGWWATSALESNVGLGHIAQWVSSKKISLAQGLGTGALYKNNFPSTTALRGEELWFQAPEEPHIVSDKSSPSTK